MSLQTIKRLSPNHDVRRLPIDMIVLHYTGMQDAEAALQRLCDPAAKVSAHYLIDEEGRVYSLVDETARAWHAGVASWHGETDINSCSIGIELANPGHEFGYRPFPESQMARLEDVCRVVMVRHDISAARVLGHSDVAPGRKMDPGELFDWSRLAAKGLALWPDPGPARDVTRQAGDAGDEIAALQVGLAAVGYGIAADGIYGEETEAVVRAFQRRFRPRLVDGRCDPETMAMLDGLLALFVDL